MRALAYGWRYKSMFERGITIEQITKTEHKAERTIYKILGAGVSFTQNSV